MKKILLIILVVISTFSCKNNSNKKEINELKEEIQKLKEGSDENGNKTKKTELNKSEQKNPKATENKKQVISQKKVNVDFIKTFEGKIDNQYDYIIKIIANSGKISGKYFYKSDCKNIDVKGTLSQNSNFVIKEYAYGFENEPTGYFEGKMTNEHKIEGTWKKKENSKKIPFYFIETNESYNSSLQNCINSRNNKIFKTLIIDEVSLLKFPETKDGSRAWDNPMGSFKPDIYIKVFDTNRNLLVSTQNNDYHNKDNSNLPIVFKFKNGIKVENGKYKNGIIIQIVDLDLSTEDDIMGTIKFEPQGEHFNTIKNIRSFENEGLKIKVTSHFEK